jgi:hypothetical protein
MTTAFIRHHVRDYDAWRKVYDDFASVQDAGGVKERAVYRSVADGNDLLVTHLFDNADQANTFLAGAELRQAMGDAGVDGGPTIDLFEEAD